MSDRMGGGHGASQKASGTRDPTIDDGCGPGNVMVVAEGLGGTSFPVTGGPARTPKTKKTPTMRVKISVLKKSV